MTQSDTDKIIKVVEFSAPISRVWKAITDYKAFGEWFRVNLDQPFEVGGKSTGYITYPGHEHVAWLVFVERMDSENLFSFRWYDTENPAAAESGDLPPLLVEFALEEISGGTRLTITESGFSGLENPRRIELMRGNIEGWNIQAGHIRDYLSAN